MMELIRCDVCNTYSSSRLMEYEKFWGQWFCPEHNLDGTPRCSSCGRFKQEKFEDVDGVKICSECCSTAILDPQQLEPFIEKVLEFYKSLNLEVTKEDIRVLLVDHEEMWKHCKTLDYFKGYSTEKAEKWRPCAALRFPRGGGCAHVITRITKCSKTKYVFEVKKEEGSFPRDKITILILFGIPDVYISGYLAQEMMHAWLMLQNCREGLEVKVEEGICEVMKDKWMEHFCSGDDLEQGQFKRNLKDMYFYIRRQWRYSQDIYGKGYREATKAVKEFGFQETVKHIVQRARILS